MDKILLNTILNDWNFWEKDQETGINSEEEIKINKKIINVKPIYEWLLE
ncbi:MAG: hypothetical protein ABIA91_00530 [Patescibacteria group bacterium]